MEPATIALCVGHSRSRPDGRPEGGAISTTGVSEWQYNIRLARRIAIELHECHGLDAVIVDDYQGSSYGSAMRWLAGHLRSLGNIRLAVELHFNASDNPAAGGHEWFYWHRSPRGRALAESLHYHMSMDFPPLPARGAKPMESGRGSEFLRLTHCPAVICEPYFGTNPHDWKIASSYQDGIARTISDAIAAAHSKFIIQHS